MTGIIGLLIGIALAGAISLTLETAYGEREPVRTEYAEPE